MKGRLHFNLLLGLLHLSLLLFCANGDSDSSITQLLVVINAQDNPHHLNYAHMTMAYINEQADVLEKKLDVEVIITTEDLPDVRSTWTFYPLLEAIAEEFESDDLDWVLIIQEHTEVNLSVLETLLSGIDSTKPHFIGKALQDKDRVIIHHFADTSLKYPDTSCGVLMSWPVVVAKRNIDPIDFNIDSKHELARFLYDEGKGVALTDAAEFCAADASDPDLCATRYSIDSTLCPASSTHKPVNEEDIFVMIKTGEVFHKTRVPLQLRLWTGQVMNKEICSEKLDRTIPTVKLDAPNTECGHCAKFLAILQRASKTKHIQSKKWLVIVDDDTIMNVARLRKLLSCYSTDKPVALGERYGYRAHHDVGYDYITGGGGTVLNMAAVNTLIKDGYSCPQEDSADDMMLGIWLQRSGIPILNSPLFHQAPPSSYTPEYVKYHKPFAISFHKYGQDDPEMVATEWLGLTPEAEEHPPQHSEL